MNHALLCVLSLATADLAARRDAVVEVTDTVEKTIPGTGATNAPSDTIGKVTGKDK